MAIQQLPTVHTCGYPERVQCCYGKQRSSGQPRGYLERIECCYIKQRPGGQLCGYPELMECCYDKEGFGGHPMWLSRAPKEMRCLCFFVSCFCKHYFFLLILFFIIAVFNIKKKDSKIRAQQQQL